MANIDFVEKEYFEQLFGMRSGYVLDFSNRSFQEFVYSIMKIDIYAKYHGLSKAKILRKHTEKSKKMAYAIISLIPGYREEQKSSKSQMNIRRVNE